ncbi:MAG TPA: DUF2231 domain-containing protein [Herpetosiphonaceae bacterium]
MPIVLHPFFTHFPIALLLLNLALTLMYTRRADPFWERSAYGALVIGWWGLLAAMLTGTLDVALNWPLREDAIGWINAHAALSLLLVLIYGQALLRRRRDPAVLTGPQRRGYLRLLIVGAIFLLVSGWIGGHLVYGLGFGVRG